MSRRLYTVEDVDWDGLPHDEARVMVARYLTGEPADKVAAEFGYSEHSISAWLCRHRTRAVRSDTRDLPRDELLRLLLDRWRLDDIAVHFNVSVAQVRNQILRWRFSPIMACRLDEYISDVSAAKAARVAAKEAEKQRARVEHKLGVGRRDLWVVEQYQSGRSADSIAIELDISESTIHHILERRGSQKRSRKVAAATRRRHRWSTDEDRALAEKLWADGATLTEIAREVGFSRKSVRKWLMGKGVGA